MLITTSWQVVGAVCGVIKGYVQLNLGFLISFEDMRANFHQSSRHYTKATRPRSTQASTNVMAQRCVRLPFDVYSTLLRDCRST